MKNSKISSFEDLLVWQKSHKMVLKIYEISKILPNEEKFGITSQIRRSAASIPTNIAEGYKRKSLKQYLHFLDIAYSSLEETKYQLRLCKDLGYIEVSVFSKAHSACEEISKMLYGLQRSLQK